MISIQPNETFEMLIGRLSSTATAPVGMRLEGQVLGFQVNESAPFVYPQQFNQLILPILNPAQPRLIMKVNYGEEAGCCDDTPLILCTVM